MHWDKALIHSQQTEGMAPGNKAWSVFANRRRTKRGTYYHYTVWPPHQKKNHVCAHRRTSKTPNVLRPLLLTLTPSEPSQQPPLHSLIHSLPNCPSISFFSAMHMVQKLHFWLTRLKDKGSSYASWRSPTREASIPSCIERAHTDRVSPLFSHYHFHTGLSHLAFGWCVLYPPPTLTAFSRSELNDQLDNQLIN